MSSFTHTPHSAHMKSEDSDQKHKKVSKNDSQKSLNSSLDSPHRSNVPNTAISSPLTDVLDLKDDAKSHASSSSGNFVVSSLILAAESKHGFESESDEDDRRLKRASSETSDRKPRQQKQRYAWQQAQVQQYLKFQQMKNESVSSSKDSTSSQRIHKASKRKESLPSDRGPGRKKSRRDSAVTDSGATTPLDQEEGILLPDRKRPVPYSAINAQDRSGRTLIFKYASRGDVATSEILLRAGASLRIADYAGWTPLHEACLEGHSEIVQLMLAYDADVDAPGGDGDTPLHDAIGNGHFEVVQLLLQNGASINLVNEHRQTPLEFAMEKAEEARAESMNSGKKDDEGKPKKSSDQLEANKIVKLLKVWQEMTEKVVKRDKSGQTLLHHACTEGKKSQVLKLLEYGADISASDNAGWTPLHNAALNGHADIAEILLKYGAYVGKFMAFLTFIDPLGANDETPLHDAVANGFVLCASVLLQYGAEPFRKNANGKMPKDLIPDDRRKELLQLLEYPLEHWQPVRTPAFYPKLISQSSSSSTKPSQAPEVDCVKSTVVKKEPKEPVGQIKKSSTNPNNPNKSFAWGGLEPSRGPFESSREEKKFQALLKTIQKTEHEVSDTNPKGSNMGKDYKIPSHDRPRSPSNSVSGITSTDNSNQIPQKASVKTEHGAVKRPRKEDERDHTTFRSLEKDSEPHKSTSKGEERGEKKRRVVELSGSGGSKTHNSIPSVSKNADRMDSSPMKTKVSSSHRESTSGTQAMPRTKIFLFTLGKTSVDKPRHGQSTDSSKTPVSKTLPIKLSSHKSSHSLSKDITENTPAPVPAKSSKTPTTQVPPTSTEKKDEEIRQPKRKKRFTIAGYQRAGDVTSDVGSIESSAQTVQSAAVVDAPVTAGTSKIEDVPVKTVDVAEPAAKAEKAVEGSVSTVPATEITEPKVGITTLENGKILESEPPIRSETPAKVVVAETKPISISQLAKVVDAKLPIPKVPEKSHTNGNVHKADTVKQDVLVEIPPTIKVSKDPIQFLKLLEEKRNQPSKVEEVKPELPTTKLSDETIRKLQDDGPPAIVVVQKDAGLKSQDRVSPSDVAPKDSVTKPHDKVSLPSLRKDSVAKPPDNGPMSIALKDAFTKPQDNVLHPMTVRKPVLERKSSLNSILATSKMDTTALPVSLLKSKSSINVETNLKSTTFQSASSNGPSPTVVKPIAKPSIVDNASEESKESKTAAITHHPKHKFKAALVHQTSSSQPSSSSSQTPITKPSITKVKVSGKSEVSSFYIKYCLPICAFHCNSTKGLKFYTPPQENTWWGKPPAANQTKVFVDLQLAFCLGLKSGRQLMEKYPKLIARVATSAEKLALEGTTVAQRLLRTMRATIPSITNTTMINGKPCLKLVDVDVHVITWSEDLCAVLSAHFKSINQDSNGAGLDMIQDLRWPSVEETLKPLPVKTDTKPSYVHKLKRFKNS